MARNVDYARGRVDLAVWHYAADRSAITVSSRQAREHGDRCTPRRQRARSACPQWPRRRAGSSGGKRPGANGARSTCRASSPPASTVISFAQRSSGEEKGWKERDGAWCCSLLHFIRRKLIYNQIFKLPFFGVQVLTFLVPEPGCSFAPSTMPDAAWKDSCRARSPACFPHPLCA